MPVIFSTSFQGLRVPFHRSGSVLPSHGGILVSFAVRTSLSNIEINSLCFLACPIHKCIFSGATTTFSSFFCVQTKMPTTRHQYKSAIGLRLLTRLPPGQYSCLYPELCPAVLYSLLIPARDKLPFIRPLELAQQRQAYSLLKADGRIGILPFLSTFILEICEEGSSMVPSQPFEVVVTSNTYPSYKGS